MNMLNKIERWLTVAVEWVPNKVFHSTLQPGEIGNKLARAMQDQTYMLNGREHAPNTFEVRLHPADYARFAGYANGLTTDLEQSLTDIARQHRFVVQLPIKVQINQHEKAIQRVPDVAASFKDHPGAPPAGGTKAFDVPKVPATFRLIGMSGATSGITFDVPPGASTVGRQADRSLVIDATDVSRKHARFEQSGNTLRVHDAGSTNGTWVNGIAISQTELNDRDEIRFGNQNFQVSVTRSGKWRP